MPFQGWPFSNLHNVNLDWILTQLQEVFRRLTDLKDQIDRISISTGVLSVNNKTGIVTLDAGDVGALPATTPIPVVPQMADDDVLGGMDDWTAGKTVDAATLKNAMHLISLGIASKADAFDIPTAVSDLTNDSGFQTAAQVQTAINAALSEIPFAETEAF